MNLEIESKSIVSSEKRSYFDKVNNPADGSYYIETLTAQLAEKALVLFKDIEAKWWFSEN
jgi:methylmalonyl-CoA mutase